MRLGAARRTTNPAAAFGQSTDRARSVQARRPRRRGRRFVNDKYSGDAIAIYEALGGKLAHRHCAELAASGISPEVAKLRGYATIEKSNVNILKVLGFADYQCRVPGMLLPMWNVFGKQFSAQYKPDNPG
jgi:hypothetical protein